MAKKKDIEANASSEPDYLSLVLKEIEKDAGEGVIVEASQLLNKPQTILKWGPAIDSVCGGVPLGSTLTVNGLAKSGKSTISLTLAAEAQKRGMTVYYCDIEGRIKRKNLTGIDGLDLSPNKFQIIQSTKEKILFSQDFLKYADLILRTHPKVLLIIDSISALVDQNTVGSELGKQDRGKSQQTVSQFVNNTSNVIRVMDSIILYISHRISNTSGWGESTTEKIALRAIYQADLRLRIRSSTLWKDAKERPIGKVMKIECQESALNHPPGLECESYLRFGKGIDKLTEIIQVATSSGIIGVKGSWYSLKFLNSDLLKDTSFEGKDEVTTQGAENLYQLLQANPLWCAELENRVMGFMSNLVGCGSGDV